jgi:hypothetical protein
MPEVHNFRMFIYYGYGTRPDAGIGLANAGTDLIASTRQAAAFGIIRYGTDTGNADPRFLRA